MVDLVVDGKEKERITIACLTLDGIAADNGKLGTQANPLYDSYHTTNNKCDYECGIKKYWFSSCRIPYALGVAEYTPSIVSVQHVPASCSIGDITTTRATMRICLQDQTATKNKNEIGWLTQLIASQKWFDNRRLDVWRGSTCENLCDMQHYTMYLDNVNGPVGEQCLIYLNAVDVLNLVATEDTVCPKETGKKSAAIIYGENPTIQPTLSVQLDGPSTTDNPDNEPLMHIGNNILAENLLIGAPDDEQDMCINGTDEICVGEEMVRVAACENGDVAPVGYNYTLFRRAVCGTTLSEHKVGSEITIPKCYRNMHISDVLLDLMENCADLGTVAQLCCTEESPTLINKEKLLEYRCKRPMDIIADTKICQPVSVATLIEELSQEFMLSIYPKNGKVCVDPVCPPDNIDDLPVITPELIFEGSFSVEGVTEFWNRFLYRYNTINCAKSKGVNNLDSYIAHVRSDTLKEPCAQSESGRIKTRTFLSRWINKNNAWLANIYAVRQANYFGVPRRIASFETPTEIARCFCLNDYLKVEHPKVPDKFGTFNNVWVVKEIGAVNDAGCSRVRIEETPFGEQPFLQGFTCEPGPNGEPPPMIQAPVEPCLRDQCSMRMW